MKMFKVLGVAASLMLGTATFVLASDTVKRFIIIGDFNADNGVQEKAYAARLAEIIADDIQKRGIDFGDTLSLRAAMSGGYGAKPQSWMRDVILSARDGTAPSLISGFLVTRLGDFAGLSLPEESELAWTIEELGSEVACGKVETHLYVITNGVSAMTPTSSGLEVDRVHGAPLDGCASLTWVGLGSQSGPDLELRRGIDELFMQLGNITGAEDVRVVR